MLGAVVLCVEQEHRQQLGDAEPCGDQPVSHFVGDGRHQLAQVPHHQLSAAEARTLHWGMKQMTAHIKNSFVDSALTHWIEEL